LTFTVPQSISLASAAPRSRSPVQTLALSPYGESFAAATAAAASGTGVTAATGPNVSSQATVESGSTPVNTVGS